MSSQTPPTAKKVPSERVHHGDTVVDDYAWLTVKDDPEVVAYLEAENAYTQEATAHLKPLQETLFQEIKGRTLETDLSVPTRKGGWWYYSRTEEGKQYGIQCRVAADGETPPELKAGESLPGEEVLLDGNELAGDSGFFSIGTSSVSSDGTLLAYSTNFTGDERFTLKVKNLATGETLPDEIPGIFYGGAWSADGTTFFYTTVDEAWRPNQVHRHTIGSPAKDDTLVHEEADERFWVGIGLSRSERYLVLSAGSKITSEVRVLEADDPTGEFRVVRPRETGVEYGVDHAGDHFLVLHNRNAENFELAIAPLDAPGDWTPLIEHRADTRLLDVDAFEGHTVVHFRRDGLTGIRILPRAGEAYEISFPEPIYDVAPSGNPEFVTGRLRLGYTSMVTPPSVYDYDLAARELVLLKQKVVLGGYDPADYEQFREWATASDGTRVPISIVMRKGTERPAPAVLYGYGSYEISIDPSFSIARLSLLDRGFVFAMAHVRGGGEMGRHWYEDGKFQKKKNTFTDFVAAAEHLSAAGWSSAIVARGGSAGGLLMGAVANLAPGTFAGVVAEVPFVDALNTILDPSLPLTVIEWDEWGDPLHNPEVYAYMKSYTPYENVDGRVYPPILAITSLNDTRVFYHEPAKWVAKLRDVADGGPFLLKTEMGAGHGGRSGRYDSWREEAFTLSWILDTAKVTQ
ncbi:S9 family peptidase [Streptosporangium sp. NBC_01755]|uniref:S9 family peptidase n=1 Tax=unclassified Streptosporangium TaxID=2632669 RepID=UPI002DD87E17|nr:MULTISPECIES: S9 family peptidase [unclassified Streptosporangium]WSA25743.1 S9 family peptidase [Streptosporangium sp. NBC_01810]WSD02867.1 S9 family peptidase [Streptosporangium sp. NBC_01755]